MYPGGARMCECVVGPGTMCCGRARVNLCCDCAMMSAYPHRLSPLQLFPSPIKTSTAPNRACTAGVWERVLLRAGMCCVDNW